MNTPQSTRFGEYVALRRRSYALSASALAKEVDVSTHAIMDIESGKTDNPSLLTVLQICRVLEIPPNEMASYYGLYPGDSLSNDRLTRQLAQTLTNLEELGMSLSREEQEILDEALHLIVLGYRAKMNKIRKVK